MSITRRLFLRNTAVLPLGAAALPTITAQADPVKPALEPLEYAADRVSMENILSKTRKERFDAAVIELQRAAKAIDPSISDWNIGLAANDDLGVRFIAVASRESVQEPSRKAKRRARI